MRLFEFESKVKAEVYIDMDGVLVDFFDAWAKLMGEKSFRDIKDIDKGLQAIRDEDDFWLKLKPTPNAGKLLALVRELKGSYTILSSPLADDPRSEPHKRMWVEKNLKQFPPKKVIITGDKAKYAQQSDGTPNILIDDFGQNIAKWEAAGGIGVKHKDHKFERTFKSLMNHLKQDDKVKEVAIDEKSAVTTDLELDNIPDIDLNKALDIMAHDPETFNGQRLKDVFIMRYKNKMTFTEIGAEINTGTDRARQIYQRSLRKLRFLLKDYMSENFADGKVKGKSRPGRFKKAGVSCKGSVTDLRRKAKNASGERQKGYHWCANMKSGRNK